jgi:deazaflavin-dependent oxidoreductase (nitroreductase family)
MSVAAAAGAERWGQVLGSRAWPHGPARLESTGARPTQVVRTANESGSLICTRARGKTGEHRRRCVSCDLRLLESLVLESATTSDRAYVRGQQLAAGAAIVHPRRGMSKTYRRHLGARLINWWFRTLTKLGLGARYRRILTVPGRKTGRPHSTPVDVIAVGGDRWLVAGYGPVNWVLNTRAHGAVTLSRGGHSETYKVEEVRAEAPSRYCASTSPRSASRAPTSTRGRTHPRRPLRPNCRDTRFSA